MKDKENTEETNDNLESSVQTIISDTEDMPPLEEITENTDQNQGLEFETISINEHVNNQNLALSPNNFLKIQSNASFSGVIDANRSAASQDFIFVEQDGILRAGTVIKSATFLENFTLSYDVHGPKTICLNGNREVTLGNMNDRQELDLEINNNENQLYNFGPIVVNDYQYLANSIVQNNSGLIIIENGGSVYGAIDAKAIDINCNIVLVKEGGILKAGTQIIPGAFEEPYIITIEKDIHGPASISVGDQRQVVIHQDNPPKDLENNDFELLFITKDEDKNKDGDEKDVNGKINENSDD
jgi:hypothetical protein